MPLVTFNDDYDATCTFFAKDVERGIWFSKGEASRIAEDCATMPGTDYVFRWNERIECFEELQEGDDGNVWVAVQTKVDKDGITLYYMGDDWEWRTVKRPSDDVPMDEWQFDRVEEWDDLDREVNRLIRAHNDYEARGMLHYEIGSWE